MAFQYIISVSHKAILAEEGKRITGDLLESKLGTIKEFSSAPWYLTEGFDERLYHLISYNPLKSTRVKKIQEDFERKKREIKFFELVRVE